MRQRRDQTMARRSAQAVPLAVHSADLQVSPDELKAGIDHPAGVWFAESVRELSFRATNLNVVYTLLHFKNSDRAIWHAEPTIEDSYDRFQRT